VSAIVQSVAKVEAYGENLSIVTTSEGHQVIANKKDDGSFRWEAGETVVYVSEGSIIPDEVLKDRGYWDEEKDRGLLDGGKRNRVKMKKLAGFESRGLLFKVHHPGQDWTDDFSAARVGFVAHPHNGESNEWLPVIMGQDVSSLFGITEFQG
jgi:hypothetical protein